MVQSARSILRLGFLLAGTLIFSGCTEFIVVDRTVNYNLAVEKASNRLLLLNAVRAYKRYPMHFAAISKITADGPLSGTFALPIPFSGDVNHGLTLTSTVSVKSGTTVEIAILNKQKFFRGILKQVSLSTFNFYWEYGWPKELLILMFIRKIKLGEEDFVNSPDGNQRRFKRFKAAIEPYVRPLARERKEFKPCEIKKETTKKEIKHKLKIGPDGDSISIPFVTITEQEVASTEGDKCKTTIFLRTAEAMIFYMGQLIKAKRSKDKRKDSYNIH